MSDTPSAHERVLAALAGGRERSFRELREATGLDRVRLSNALVSLEIRALVESRKGDDSRNRYKLTRTGRAQAGDAKDDKP